MFAMGCLFYTPIPSFLEEIRFVSAIGPERGQSMRHVVIHHAPCNPPEFIQLFSAYLAQSYTVFRVQGKSFGKFTTSFSRSAVGTTLLIRFQSNACWR